MVLVRTNVTREVYELLQNNETVEAVTNFDKAGFQEPYQFLKELTGFDNFFFGLAADSYDTDRIDELCEMSSDTNSIKLLLNIPIEELASMNYYTFSDLIFYTECEVDEEIADQIKTYLKTRLNSYDLTPLDRDIIQVVYPLIKPEYILKVEEL